MCVAFLAGWLLIFFGHFLGDNLYPFASTHCPPWHSVFDFRLESHRLTRVYTNPSLFDDAAPATPFIFQIFWARGNWRWFYPSNKTTALKSRDDAKTCFLRKKHGETNWKHPETPAWQHQIVDPVFSIRSSPLMLWWTSLWTQGRLFGCWPRDPAGVAGSSMALEKSEGLTHTGLTNQPSSMFLV